MTSALNLAAGWRDRAHAEWERWANQYLLMDGPAIDEPDGLPEEWQMVANRATDATASPASSGGAATGHAGAAVVRRIGGGWLLVLDNAATLGGRDIVLAGATLTALYVETARPLPQGGGSTAAAIDYWARNAELVRGPLIEMYDHDDPAERAEAMLLAMGGRVTAPPRADVVWGEALLLVAESL